MRKKMTISTVTYTPIGIIHSSFNDPRGTPIQPGAAEGCEGRIEIFPEFCEGLRDLDAFSHIILLYHFHRAGPVKLLVEPFMDHRSHGIFAIRGPARPNPIGISVLRLESIENNILFVKDIDILDNTPLLDIKPYVPAFDVRPAERSGWLEENIRKLPTARDDGRFEK
jgi:tRNA (adenine37-N6)-methyltransferase